MNYQEILQFARVLRKNQTAAEEFFWQNVRNRKMLGLKFNRQFILEYQPSSYFIVDFHCFELKLIIELDGPIHLKKREDDLLRDQILTELGYSVWRFKNEEILNDWSVFERNFKSKLNTRQKEIEV